MRWKIGAFLFPVVLLSFFFSLFSFTSASGPSSNRVLNYQLRLTDPSGIPVADGARNIKISFYDASTGGTTLHTDCGTTGTPLARKVVFSNGVGTVLIGDAAADASHNCADGSAPNAIPATLFNNTALFLGITVGADAEMTPRKRVVAQGYSLNADRLDDLETSAIGGAVAFVPVTDASGNLTLTQNLTVDSPTFFVDAVNNRIGVGTISPAADLQVKRGTNSDFISSGLTGSHAARVANTTTTADENGLLLTTGRGGATDNWILAAGSQNVVTGAYIDYFRVRADGNVGIGTTAPDAKLEITDDNSVKMILSGTALHQAFINFEGVPGNTDYKVGKSGSTDFAILQGAGNDDVFHIGSTGNIGLGDGTPVNFRLEVAGSVGPSADDAHDLGSNAFRWRDLYTGPGTIHVGTATGDEGTISYDTTTNALSIDSAGAVDINGGSGSSGCSIDASGNFTCAGSVSGGTSSAFVDGGNAFGAAATLGTNDDFNLNFETNDANRMTIDNVGNVGINDTTPTESLTVAGDAFVTGHAIMGNRFTPGDLGEVALADRVLSVAENYATNDLRYGIRSFVTADPTGSSQQIISGSFVSVNSLTNATDPQIMIAVEPIASLRGIADTTDLMGVNAIVGIEGTGTATEAYAVHTRPVITSSGTISTYYALAVNEPTVSGGGTIGTFYGLAIDDLPAPTATGLEFPIYYFGSSKFALTGDTRLGIGTDAPDGKLDVRQAAAADIMNLYDGATNVFTVLDGGNVGIGDPTPVHKLDVTGAIGISDTAVIDSSRRFFAANGAVGAGTLAYSFSADTNTGLFGTGSDVLGIATAGAESARFYTDSGFPVLKIGGSAATGVLKLGVDSTAALHNLEIASPSSLGGPAASLTTHGSDDTASSLLLGRRTSGTQAAPTATEVNDGILNVAGVGHTGSVFTPQVVAMTYEANQAFTPSAHGTRIDFWTTGNGTTAIARRVRIDDSGNLILNGDATGPNELRLAEDTDNGTNYGALIAPASLLSNLTYTLPGSSGTLALTSDIGAPSGWTDGGTNVVLTASTDNVGIGGAPLAKLSVDGDTDEVQFLVQGHSSQTANFMTVEDSGGTDLFVINTSGNVGIGSFSPTLAKLQVNATASTGIRVDAADQTALHATSNESSGVAFHLDPDGLTTGYGLLIDGNSGVQTSAVSAEIRHNAFYNSSATVSGNVFNVLRQNIANAGAVITTSGPMVLFTENNQVSGGSLVSTNDMIRIAENNATTGNTFHITSAGTGPIVRVEDDDGTFGNDTSPFVIDAGGSVGIGDATPDATFDIDQPAATSGSPKLALWAGGAHTGLTASTEAIDVDLALNRTVQFATGSLTTQRAFVIRPPTYAFAGASSLTVANTMNVMGPPVAGTNATLSHAIALAVGDFAGDVSAANRGIGTMTMVPGITNGTGSVGFRTALWVTTPIGEVSLGDQTATLDDFNMLRIDGVTMSSATNTRTVDNAASIYVGDAPTAGTNVTVTSGPYSIFVDDGLSRFDMEGGTVAAFNREIDDGTIISLMQGGTEEGSISVSGTTISYNAFTGSHYAWTNERIEQGMLVRYTGQNRHLHGDQDSEMLYGIMSTATRNDPTVLGAYLSLKEPSQPANDENPHLVMAVGNGDLWVVNEGENIAPGDYLMSSDTAGHAMKDQGTEEVSHLIARAAEAVDWNAVTETVGGKKHMKISVTFVNFTRRSQAQTSELTVTGDIDFKGYGIENVSFLRGLNGLWSIDERGGLIAKTVDVDKVTTKKLTIKNEGTDKTAGRGLIPTGAISTVVDNANIDSRSLIGVTFEGNPGSVWWISEKGNGHFTLNLSAPAAGDIAFTYWVIGIEGEEDPLPLPPETPPAPPEEGSELTPEPPAEEPPPDEESAPEPAPTEPEPELPQE